MYVRSCTHPLPLLFSHRMQSIQLLKLCCWSWYAPGTLKASTATGPIKDIHTRQITCAIVQLICNIAHWWAVSTQGRMEKWTFPALIVGWLIISIISQLAILVLPDWGNIHKGYAYISFAYKLMAVYYIQYRIRTNIGEKLTLKNYQISMWWPNLNFCNIFGNISLVTWLLLMAATVDMGLISHSFHNKSLTFVTQYVALQLLANAEL